MRTFVWGSTYEEIDRAKRTGLVPADARPLTRSAQLHGLARGVTVYEIGLPSGADARTRGEWQEIDELLRCMQADRRPVG